MKSDLPRVPVVDAIKALASQLIVWHHLAFYGPMSDAVYAYAPGLFDWLYEYARMAVQAFLAVGGFLAARSLAPCLEPVQIDAPRLIWKRYVRLTRPYLAALAAAIACAAAARTLIHYPSFPEAPTLAQVLAHVFLLQDIVGQPSLSAGVWYVAIDFHLYVLLLLLLRSSQWISAMSGTRASLLAVGVVACVASASLFWFNRNPDLDIYAPYFFGAYGLGVMAQWISTAPRKLRWTCLLALLIAAALLLHWRSRILVAGVTAVVIASSAGYSPRWACSALVTWLGRISYSVFLIHYPVFLVVSAVVFRFWPANHTANGIGLFATWLLSLAAGTLTYETVERRPWGRPGAINRG